MFRSTNYSERPGRTPEIAAIKRSQRSLLIATRHSALGKQLKLKR